MSFLLPAPRSTFPLTLRILRRVPHLEPQGAASCSVDGTGGKGRGESRKSRENPLPPPRPREKKKKEVSFKLGFSFKGVYAGCDDTEENKGLRRAFDGHLCYRPPRGSDGSR